MGFPRCTVKPLAERRLRRAPEGMKAGTERSEQKQKVLRAQNFELPALDLTFGEEREIQREEA